LVLNAGVCSFTTGCLRLIHKALMSSIHSLENERIKGMLLYFIPTTQLLLSVLSREKYFGEAARVCEASLSFMRKQIAIKELKILNSTLWEQSLGLQNDNGSQTIAPTSEFSFHETLAGTKNWKAGYNQIKSPLDEFCEFLEREVVTFSQRAAVKDVTGSSEKKDGQRKVLESAITIRDLVMALETSLSPEAIYYELLRFRKTPRYLELCFIAIEWASKAGHVELAAKLALETEDWLGKRNIAFFTFSSVAEGNVKWEIAFRKNKKKKLAPFKAIGEAR
jgi:hypothetical protein